VTMTDKHGHYCGEPDPAGCNACIQERPCGTPDIGTWREANRHIADSAERVLAPCSDAAARFARYFPRARLIVAPHPEPHLNREPSPLATSPNERLRIAVLGSMVPHKGLAKLIECAALARKRRLPLDFRLIGEATGQRAFPFSQTGRYAPHEAGRLLSDFNPHVVWFPGEAPETYSFTLSLCLERGLPVAAPRIGCFPERLSGRRYTWLAPHHWKAEEWLRFFCDLRTGDSLAAFAVESSPAEIAPSDFYEAQYLEPGQEHRA
jgi:O-antigen biosynthesis protein